MELDCDEDAMCEPIESICSGGSAPFRCSALQRGSREFQKSRADAPFKFAGC